MRAITSAVFVAMLGASSAQAQSATYDGLAFDDAKHRGWYVRFLTGSCSELRYVVCQSGNPHWGEITQRLLAMVPAQRRERFHVRLVLLGRSIGYEWAKENNIRRINNDHIQSWSSDLKRTGDAEQSIGRIESDARALLGGTGEPRRAQAERR